MADENFLSAIEQGDVWAVSYFLDSRGGLDTLIEDCDPVLVAVRSCQAAVLDLLFSRQESIEILLTFLVYDFRCDMLIKGSTKQRKLFLIMEAILVGNSETLKTLIKHIDSNIEEKDWADLISQIDRGVKVDILRKSQ